MLLLQLKSLLEKEVCIIDWNPSKEQLVNIAKFIKANPNNLDNLCIFISETCDDVTLMLLEGNEYSDIYTLLALAKAVVDECE
ncbi:hypothetical protein GLP21_08095 [Photobacterium carnosum]|uniref:hypothetical protein n=1 Tax=Photobacterium carnosum TaxID=2023717 RepID=UPI001E294FA4|nr:hypothetical protein [Photobacterium carnosum]MCD9548593.1 hypothetical protein [Photobacterium carnosum]MCF2304949.1 hypothetical protein [Photobacterium carnosum]